MANHLVSLFSWNFGTSKEKMCVLLVATPSEN